MNMHLLTIKLCSELLSPIMALADLATYDIQFSLYYYQ